MSPQNDINCYLVGPDRRKRNTAVSSSTTVGSADRPLRVAVVGSGPAGVYAADILTKSEAVKSGELTVSIDLFDRYPAPYGLIRYGVAPDHPRIKGIVNALHKVLDRGDIRFLGNVTYGRDLTLHTGFLARLAHRGIARQQARLGIALGNDPAPGVPRRDEQDPDLPVRLDPIGKHAILFDHIGPRLAFAVI